MSSLLNKESFNSDQNECKFDDMQLKIGDKLLLNILSNTIITCCSVKSNFCMVSLIGYVPNSSLLVTMPKSEQHGELPLIQGDQFSLRLFNGQYGYNFTAYVEELIKKPFSYIHLSFPSRISRQIIRNSRRVETKLTATVNDLSAPVLITNISLTGAEICTKEALLELETGKTITLSFQLPFEEKKVNLQLKSHVRLIKNTKADEKSRIFGIEFIDMELEHTFSLRNFIHQELVKNPFQRI